MRLSFLLRLAPAVIAVLALVHLLVRADKNVAEGVVLPGDEARVAHGDGQQRLMLPIRLVVRLDQRLGAAEPPLQIRLRRILDNGDELVAADAEGVPRPEALGDDVRRRADRLVTAGVSVTVVDVLEVVDIEHDHGEAGGAVQDLRLQLLLPLQIRRRIADAGERIGVDLRVHIVQIPLHFLVHGVDPAPQRAELVVLAVRGGLPRRSLPVALRVARAGEQLPGQRLHVVGQRRQLRAQLAKTPPHAAVYHQERRRADHGEHEAEQNDEAGVPPDLPVVPIGVEIDADDARDLPLRIKHGAERAEKAAPAVRRGGVVHRGDPVPRLLERFGEDDLLAEFARIDRIGIHHEDKGVLAGLPDGVDVFDVRVVLERGERVIDLVVLRRADVLLRKRAERVAVHQIGGGVGDADHALADQVPHHRGRLPQQKDAQHDIRQQKQHAEHNDILCRQA